MTPSISKSTALGQNRSKPCFSVYCLIAFSILLDVLDILDGLDILDALDHFSLAKRSLIAFDSAS